MSAESTDGHQVCKRVSMLCRRAHMTTEDFRTHWAGPHAAIARSIPGIARYTQNRVLDRLWSFGSDGYDCDGLVELEFQDEAAMLDANSHAAVQRLLPQDELRFLGAITLCRVPGGARQVIPDLVKVMLAVRWLQPEPDSRNGWLNGIGRSRGCVHFTHETVASSFHRAHLKHEDAPPHQFSTFWFESEHLARVAFDDGPGKSPAPGAIQRAAAWLMDPLAIVA